MLPTQVTRRRYAARYRRITTTLVAHGFGGLIAPLDFRVRTRLPFRRQTMVDVDDETLLALESRQVSSVRAVHLRHALEELGPTFIKFGQILSTRSDLLPPEYIAELVKLQDNVPPAPFAAIAMVIEEELGKPLTEAFASVEPTPLAAASIGQVHAAKLPDGADVVIKVQRPGVERLIEEDLAILTDLAGLAERRLRWARRFDLTGLVSEFAWTLRGELDYIREGHNAERLALIFADDPAVRIPRVTWSHVTGRVLTLERLQGIRIDDVATMRAAGHDPAVIARRAAKLFLRQVFEEAFFHADPHPGNFIVLSNGAIGAMDFGMVGSLDERLREQLVLMLIAVVERDAIRITDDLVALGAAGPELARSALERDVGHLLAQYYGRTLADVPIARVIQDVMSLIRRHGLRLPAELALLAKTVVMQEALARRLDPTFDVQSVAEPYGQEAIRRLYSFGFWRRKLKLRPLEVMLLGTALPGHVQRLLTRLERNELMFRVHYEELPQLLSGLNGMVNRLALAILTASAGIGLAILYQATQPSFGSWKGGFFIVGFAGVTVIGFLLLIAIWRSGR
jgi:ubiquinone biosynthesis protein